MTALHYTCMLVLVYLLPLLLQPEDTVAKEVQLSQPPSLRGANWLPNFGKINKYVEKFLNSSLKSKDSKKSKSNKSSKKPTNATKAAPPNTKEAPSPTLLPEPQVGELQQVQDS